MPCGQKKKTREISHSHTVLPPLAEMEGTTLRLTMATTKSSTRSQRPRTRLRCAASDCGSLVDISQVPRGLSKPVGHGSPRASLKPARLMRGDGDRFLFLRLGQGRSDLGEHLKMHGNVFRGMLHGYRPLLVPPVGL